MAGREKLTTHFHVMLTVSYSLDPNSINILQSGVRQWEDNLRSSETEKKNKKQSKAKTLPNLKSLSLAIENQFF